MELAPVNIHEIDVHAPMPWALYSKDNAVLVGEGAVIKSQERLESLAKLGLFREILPDEPDEASNEESETESRTAVGKPAPQRQTLSFSEIKLKAGDRMQIEPPSILCPERLPVKYIGHLKDVSVIVTLPMKNGFPLALREGEKIVMRAFSGQNVFGFTATIDRICKFPFNYLHLSYPEQVSGLTVRNSPRIKTRIIASIEREGSEKTSGMLANLSTTGAGLDARQALGKAGDLLTLSFRVDIHNVEMYLMVKAAIIALIPQAAGDAGTIRHGLEFRELSPNDCVLLQSLIYRHMVENPENLI
jgi:hypothetical protein